MGHGFLSLFPAAFPALALAHFIALLSPGPDFFLILGHAVRHRLRGSFFICVGITFGHAFYILLAVAGWFGLKHSGFLYRVMEILGSAYLFWLGLLLYRSSRHVFQLDIKDVAPLTKTAQFVTGFFCALLNPKNALFYLALMTVIIGTDATILQQGVTGIWMVTIVFLWDFVVAVFISLKKVQQKLITHVPMVERISAIVLIGLAVSILGSSLFRF